jgi:hypothetical protein
MATTDINFTNGYNEKEYGEQVVTDYARHRQPSSVPCFEVKVKMNQRIQDNKNTGMMKLHPHECQP